MLAALAICGCGSSANSTDTSSPAVTREVSISNYTFEPETVTVPVGSKLTFVNRDSTAHTATSTRQGAFDTEPIKPDQRATVTLSEPGTFTYYCVFHPFMKGTVKVE